MKIGHFVNELTMRGEVLEYEVGGVRVKTFVESLWLAMSGAPPDAGRIAAAGARKFVWRLIVENIFAAPALGGAVRSGSEKNTLAAKCVRYLFRHRVLPRFFVAVHKIQPE
jgi:hypothetical protein